MKELLINILNLLILETISLLQFQELGKARAEILKRLEFIRERSGNLEPFKTPLDFLSVLIHINLSTFDSL